jgi:hypothetical protein
MLTEREKELITRCLRNEVFDWKELSDECLNCKDFEGQKRHNDRIAELQALIEKVKAL